MTWKKSGSAITNTSNALQPTAVQRCQNPWLDWVEVDAFDPFTPRKQLSLYFIDRVRRVCSHFTNHDCLAQLKISVLSDIFALRGSHLQSLEGVHNRGTDFSKRKRTFTSNRMLNHHYAEYGRCKEGGKEEMRWLFGCQQNPLCKDWNVATSSWGLRESRDRIRRRELSEVAGSWDRGSF
jgi:hypothetical protein